LERIGAVTRTLTGLRAVRGLLVGATLVLCASATPAIASPVGVTADTLEPTLKTADDDSVTASLGFTNLTNEPVTLTVEGPGTLPRGCTLELDGPELPEASHADVKLTVPSGCHREGERLAVTVKTDSTPTSFAITAAPPKKTDIDWNALRVFAIAPIPIFIVLLVVFAVWKPARPEGTSTPITKPKLSGGLEYLGSKYDFKESWATTVTGIGALLTGFVGSSDVVKAAIGKDADKEIALATIGAAMALAFIAAGPVVPLALKKRSGLLTPLGLIVGAAVTLTGAAGQLWVMYVSGENLDLGWIDDWLLLPTVLAALLLVVYAVSALIATLDLGAAKPKKTVPDAIAAATLIVEALKGQQGYDAAGIDAALQQLERLPTSPGDEPLRATAL
jgi:hypothetical protein